MSFKVYDYRCTACGEVDENRFVLSSEADDQTCESCSGEAIRLISAPRLDIAGMAKAGCPGAYETVGDRITKSHRSVDQHHRKGGR